jgi:hypothetical protein
MSSDNFLDGPVNPQGVNGILKLGHREYVGGLWEEIGKLQFEFLISEGLKPYHYFLDIGCGSLRGGVHFIPYLEIGHYLGIEKEKLLIRAGINKELGKSLYKLKKPHLIISKNFEFGKFGIAPDYALAQSLFTHLPALLIHTCFGKLRRCMKEHGRFYATFFEVEREISNPQEPHDHGYFAYTRRQIEQFGLENGWKTEYIGKWKHPRDQVIVRYRPQI